MVAAYRRRLEQGLSRDRLDAYALPGDGDLDTVARYFWNIALCQSLYLGIGSLEVVVRNSIHATLSAAFDAADWYDAPGLLQKREVVSVADAKRKLRLANKSVRPGRIVAALPFGFWTSLLSTLYGNSPTGPHLWVSPGSALLISAFPRAPGNALGVRRPIFNRLDDIRLLRNRVVHFERVCHGIDLPSRGRKHGAPPRHVPLALVHADCVDMIGWIDPVFQATVNHLDTFPHVYQQGFDDIRDEIATYVGDS